MSYHYVDVGQGPVLLLLHGFTGSAQNWAGLQRALAVEARTIALDLPGHGESSAPADASRYGMAAVAADLYALLDHLEIARAHLLGYSMGGRLALYLAVRHPGRWRSLILESASPGLATTAEREARVQQDEALAAFIEAEGIAAFVARWEALPLFASQKQLPPDVQQAHRTGRLANRAQGLAGSLRGMGTGVQPSLWAELGGLALPALLIAGAEDRKFVGIGRRMVSQLPRAKLVLVSDAGHTVHLEQPQAYADRVRQWLVDADHMEPQGV
jgi:2-succinyl-6-hydroxy-2,4-cyclohexadiene-1-carboxylate synthase